MGTETDVPAEAAESKEPEEPKPEPELPVDKDWLEKIINDKSGTKANIKGYKCSIIGEGKGFLSVCTKVLFEWEGEDLSKLPKGVIIKKPTLARIDSLGMKDFTDLMDQSMLHDCHNNEVRAYTFFNKHGEPPIPLATLYYAEQMDGPGSGLLVLEDLSPVAISLAFCEDSNKEKILHLAEHLATLQAFGFNHADWSDYIVPMNIEKFKEMMGDTDGMIRRIHEAFPDVPYSCDEITKKYNEVTSGFDMFADPRENGYTPVIALGDVQPNNILWKKNAEGKTSDSVAAFIDFQIAMVGYCVTDLANTMITTMPAKLRRECEEEVFNRYLEVLTEKSNGPVPLKMSEIKSVYRKFLCLMSLMNFPMFMQIYDALGIDPSHKTETYDRFLAAFEDSQIVD